MQNSFLYEYDNHLSVIYDNSDEHFDVIWENSFDFFINPSDTNLQFPKLKNQWLKETMFLSDPKEIYFNDNYIKIIELGKKVIPYLIEDLKMASNDWLFALNKITGDDPIAQNHIGNFRLMKTDWLNWAERTGWRNLDKENLVIDYAFND